MFHLDLFRIRAFSAGNLAGLLAAMGRGGLQFILIIWLQGIWLPEHGYAFSRTPLWAGIYMLPLIAGLLVAGPASGYLSDRFGARPFATGGMLIAAASFVLLIVLPVSFAYEWFAAILLLNGIGMGLFTAPNSAGVMNSLPPTQRGAGAGMLATFVELGERALDRRLLLADDRRPLLGPAGGAPRRARRARGRRAATRRGSPHLPPVSTLFASFLGYNPVETLLGPHVLHSLPAADAQTLTGRSFFPHLISGPFHTALVYAFVFAILACLVAAFASLLRGGKYHHAEEVAMPAGGHDRLEPVEPVDGRRGRRCRPPRRGDEHGAARGAPPDRRGRRPRRRDSAHDPLLRGARPARRLGGT